MPKRRDRKVLTHRKRTHSAPPKLCRTRKQRRPEPRHKQWTDEQMNEALKAVSEGLGINQAARDHNVPRTTLRDRVSGRVKHGTKPCPSSYLNATEESELANFVKQCAQVGYGKTRKEVMHIAQSVANEKGILRRSQISHGWWARFVQRQQDLSLRRGDSAAHVRMDAVNKETMEHYFSLLEDTLADHNLLNSPTQIYNVDESGVPFDPNPPNIVAKKGSKKVRYRTSGKKGQVTIVGCANAAGQVLPPMIIFDVKKINHAWTKDEVPGTIKAGLRPSCSECG